MLEFENRSSSNRSSIEEFGRHQGVVLKIVQSRNHQVLVRSQTDAKSETKVRLERSRMPNNCKKQQETEKEFHIQQLAPQAIFQVLEDAVIATDSSGKIIFLNAAAEKLIGWKLQDAQSWLICHTIKVNHKSTSSSLENLAEEILHANRFSRFCHYALLVTFNQALIKIAYSTFPIYDKKQAVGIALVFRDTNSLQKTDHYKYYQPEYDSLTGLVSRSSFESYLEQALHSVKTLDQNHILCYLDLDRFKIINEVCGHLAGDEFLRQFSAVLQTRIRKTDILARLGSDEFGLILQHCNLEKALGVLQSLHEEVRKFRFFWRNHTFNLTFSAGIALIHSDSKSGSNVLIEADSACSVAKGKGRDRTQIYQADDQDVAAQRGDIKGVLHVIGALEKDRFLLYVQPIVPINSVHRSNYQNYYEVLIRLQDEQGRLVPPNEFLPAAERYGLMHLVDRWVIQSLFRRLKPKGVELETTTCESTCKEPWKHCYSINLSGSSFNDDQFLEFVQEQFTLHQVPPQSICFEITETVAISNLNKATKFISQLREMGCRFALDDFGSGMSSFGYLRTLSVDYIKIDGNFVKEITENPLSYEIVKSINSIGHAMNIQTTAEFVENEEILAALKTIGIDYAQGYGIAKPSPF